jgi:hypothetical protein
MAVFYTAASLSGAFSGLLAFAIEKMDGIAGKYSRRDIYLFSNSHMAYLRTIWMAVDVCIPSFTP